MSCNWMGYLRVYDNSEALSDHCLFLLFIFRELQFYKYSFIFIHFSLSIQ